MQLQGARRRIVYVVLYEAIAIAAATAGFALIGGQPAAASSVVAVASSAIAVVWNLGFNWAFERWEARQAVPGRTLRRRIAHAIGFEGGLALFLVPLMAWAFGVGLWHALVMDAGLLVFFLTYTFVFHWGFDQIFGLPALTSKSPLNIE